MIARLTFMMQEVGLQCSNQREVIIQVDRLYNAVRQSGLTKIQWKDTDALIAIHDPVCGWYLRTSKEVYTRCHLAEVESAVNFVTNRKEIWN